MDASPPRISVCMIVKNEEEMLPRALQSARELADELVVVDTGSTDRTVAIAEEFGAKVYHHPWEHNFSLHRNQSIGYATGDWIFTLDADEELDASGVAMLRQAVAKTDGDVIAIPVFSRAEQGTHASNHNSARLFRAGRGIRYEGTVHNELVFSGDALFVPARLYHYGYDLSREKMTAKFNRTTELLRQGMQADPTNPRWPHYLAVSYFTEHLLPETAEMAARSIALCGEDHKLRAQWIGNDYLAAAVAFEQHDYARAEALCRQGLAIASDYLDLWAVYTSLTFMSERYEELQEAAKAFLTLAEIHHQDPGRFGTRPVHTLHHVPFVRLRLGMAAVARGDEAAFEQELALAMAASADPAETILTAVGFFLKRRELARAEALLTRFADQESPYAGRVNEELIKLLIDLGRFDEARMRLMHPSLSPHLRDHLTGLWAFARSDWPEAERVFSTLIERNARDTEARMRLAAVFERKEDFEEAERVYLEAINAAPDPIEAALNLGNLYARLGRFNEAIAFLEKVAQADDARLDVHLLLARLYWEVDDADGLLRHGHRVGQRLFSERADGIESAADLGALFLEIGEALARRQSSSALFAYELSTLLTPNEAKSHLGFGMAMARHGQHQSALASFEQAARLDPQNREAFSGLAASYEALGAVEAAEMARARAHSLAAG